MSAEKATNSALLVKKLKETNVLKVNGTNKYKIYQENLGWIYHRSQTSGENCYLFILNGGAFKDWISADHHCTSIGASMMEINDNSEQLGVQILDLYACYLLLKLSISNQSLVDKISNLF